MVGPVQLCTDGTFLYRSSVYLQFSRAQLTCQISRVNKNAKQNNSLGGLDTRGEQRRNYGCENMLS